MGDFNGDNYNDKFLGDLVNFVASDRFQTMFESFFLTYALVFSKDEEHKLEYYELYQKFHEMFDEQLQEFCDQLNMTQADFMKRCKAASTQDEKARQYINILLSSVEYETFVKLMLIMRPVAEMRASAAKTPSSASKKEGKGGSDAPALSPAKMSKDTDQGAPTKFESKGEPPAADAKTGSTPYESKSSSK